ncbi:MAG: hypothetical protein ACLFPA_00470 [Dichotomicrobium sp.]
MLMRKTVAAVALVAGPVILIGIQPALARSVTATNNCEADTTRCLRVYNGIAKTEFCLEPGQSYTVEGLRDDATYCAWCADEPLPEDCKRRPVRFD